MNKKEFGVLGLIVTGIVGTIVYEICKIKREQEEIDLMNKVKLDAERIAREAMEQEHKDKMNKIQDDYLKWKEESDKEFEEWKENIKNKFGKIESE